MPEPLSFKDYIKYLDTGTFEKWKKKQRKYGVSFGTLPGQGGLPEQEMDATSPANNVGSENEEVDSKEEIDQEPSDKQSEKEPEPSSRDPNRQGIIRTVKNAHLVYKRQDSTGGYEELWIYNIQQFSDEMDIRKDILSGTDIPPGETVSKDGSQTFDLWTIGNAQLLQIKGLPN